MTRVIVLLLGIAMTVLGWAQVSMASGRGCLGRINHKQVFGRIIQQWIFCVPETCEDGECKEAFDTVVDNPFGGHPLGLFTCACTTGGPDGTCDAYAIRPLLPFVLGGGHGPRFILTIPNFAATTAQCFGDCEFIDEKCEPVEPLTNPLHGHGTIEVVTSRCACK